MAIESKTTQQMTLNQIYEYVLENFPYYRSATHGWKNSIRHNLSLSACFQKVQRPKGHPGKVFFPCKYIKIMGREDTGR